MESDNSFGFWGLGFCNGGQHNKRARAVSIGEGSNTIEKQARARAENMIDSCGRVELAYDRGDVHAKVHC